MYDLSDEEDVREGRRGERPFDMDGCRHSRRGPMTPYWQRWPEEEGDGSDQVRGRGQEGPDNH